MALMPSNFDQIDGMKIGRNVAARAHLGTSLLLELVCAHALEVCIGHYAFHFHALTTLVDFAVTEAAYTVVRLLQAFKTIKLPEGKPLVPTGSERQNLAVVMTIGEGCHVALTLG